MGAGSLHLAYLSLTTVEAILDGAYPKHLMMKDLMEPFSMDWERQGEHFFAEKYVHPADPQVCMFSMTASCG